MNSSAVASSAVRGMPSSRQQRVSRPAGRRPALCANSRHACSTQAGRRLQQRQQQQHAVGKERSGGSPGRTRQRHALVLALAAGQRAAPGGVGRARPLLVHHGLPGGAAVGAIQHRLEGRQVSGAHVPAGIVSVGGCGGGARRQGAGAGGRAAGHGPAEGLPPRGRQPGVAQHAAEGAGRLQVAPHLPATWASGAGTGAGGKLGATRPGAAGARVAPRQWWGGRTPATLPASARNQQQWAATPCSSSQRGAEHTG